MKSTFEGGLHVAIIMDGNGRWANSRGLPRVAGHRAGADTVHRTIEAAPSLGISILTLYAFSADNWRRPPREVSALMKLLSRYLIQECDRLVANGVKLSKLPTAATVCRRRWSRYWNRLSEKRPRESACIFVWPSIIRLARRFLKPRGRYLRSRKKVCPAILDRM